MLFTNIFQKKRTVKPAAEITDNSIPRSFVFNRGEVGVTLQKLIKDVRRLMEPYTATKLKVLFKMLSNYNTLIFFVFRKLHYIWYIFMI